LVQNGLKNYCFSSVNQHQAKNTLFKMINNVS
jgi:hypothetical protein